jgi:hypothetical protein
MSLFDTIKSVLFTKKVDDYSETYQTFTPYMINRYLSFYDKAQATFVNETFNKFTNIFETKEDNFNLYFNLIPKLKYKKIEYVKKTTTEKDKDKVNDKKEELITILASNREISQREVKQYMDILNM